MPQKNWARVLSPPPPPGGGGRGAFLAHCDALLHMYGASLRMCGTFEALRSLHFGLCAVWIGFEPELFRRVLEGTKIGRGGACHGTPLESGGGSEKPASSLVLDSHATLLTNPPSPFARTWQAKSIIWRRTSTLASSAPRRVGLGTRYSVVKVGPHHRCDAAVLPVTPKIRSDLLLRNAYLFESCYAVIKIQKW